MAKSEVIQTDCLKWLREREDNSVDLIIGSPPYAGKGERYGTKEKWNAVNWISWMGKITQEAVRVSKGYVIWIANGFVKDSEYNPVCEALLWEIWDTPGLAVCERPCIWHKNAPPNRKDYFSNAWEFILVFKQSGSKPYFDWEAIAEPPKYKSGGRFRQRTTTGERRLGSKYPKNKLARPRDVFHVTVGGGHMGSKLAHQNEAPFPADLVRPFILACCPEKGIVLDPFCGSGTSLAVSLQHNRKCIGLDIRESQMKLTKRRLKEAKNGAD